MTIRFDTATCWPLCFLTVAQLRVLTESLERLVYDRGAFVQQLAKSLPELVTKGTITTEGDQDLSESKLRALNAAVHVVSTDAETSVLTARSSLEQIWETMPKGAASEATRQAARMVGWVLMHFLMRASVIESCLSSAASSWST